MPITPARITRAIPRSRRRPRRSTVFHTKMLSYYLEKLRSTPDGDGSLLDHSMILYGAGLSDANLHLYTDLSLLLVAGGVDRDQGRTRMSAIPSARR